MLFGNIALIDYLAEFSSLCSGLNNSEKKDQLNYVTEGLKMKHQNI